MPIDTTTIRTGRISMPSEIADLILFQPHHRTVIIGEDDQKKLIHLDHKPYEAGSVYQCSGIVETARSNGDCDLIYATMNQMSSSLDDFKPMHDGDILHYQEEITAVLSEKIRYITWKKE